MILSKRVCLFMLFVLVYTVVLLLLISQWSRINLRLSADYVVVASKSEIYSRSHNVSLEGDFSEDQSQANKQYSPQTAPPASLVDSRWMDVQAERKRILNNKCELYPSLKKNLTRIIHDNRRQLWPYIVDDKYRIIFGYISKVGSTNWKSAFLVLKGKYKRVEDVPGARAHDPSLRKLSSYTPQEIAYRLEHYTKFVFVRDPFTRVLSAYRSKFYESNISFQRSFGRAIITRFRPNATDEEKTSGAGVTFREFVRSITTDGNRFNDGHWNPIHQMILPCTVKFDFIGKLETADEDSGNILKYTKVDHLIHFKKSQRNSSENEDVFQRFYSQLSLDDMTSLQMKYKADFDLFGYDLTPEVVLREAPTAAAAEDSWLERQSKRKKRLNDFCQDNPSLRLNLTDIIYNRKKLLWPYIVDDKYRILYGFISKVGSTHWKSAFLVLKGKFRSVDEVPGWRAHDPSLKKLSQYSPEEIEYRLHNYTTFMFVRDPLARVLSAYRSKLEENNRSFQRSFGRAIINKYREKPSKLERETGVNVTFAEFVRFITDKEAKHNMDGHWKPIYQMVLPCNVHYDYIGKLETGKEDAENILKYLKVDHLIHFKDSKRNTSHTEEMLNKYYKTISRDYLQKLYNLYAPDFQLFGYSMSNDFTERLLN